MTVPDPLDLLPDGAVVAGPDSAVLAINRVAARMLGVDPARAIGRPLGEVLALTDHTAQRWVDVNSPYGGLVTRTGIPEQSWLLPDGTEVLVAARLNRPDRGAPVGHVAVSLRSGRGRARLDRDRSDLVATLAHELRSPLTGVKGFVNALLARWDRLSDEQKRLMLTTASVDADRLSRLIAELLDVARIDTGRLQLHRRPTDLALKAERVQQSIAVATSTPIGLTIDPHLPPIDADPDKVIQVLTNVVENGVRHGSGPVQIHVGPWRDDPSYLAVTVTDEGPGIPLDLRQRVFTKFWTGGTGGGSGLGLYIVSGLVRAHGGSVLIGDRAGGGAEVVTTWPVVAE